MNTCDHMGGYTKEETPTSIIEKCNDCGEIFTQNKNAKVAAEMPPAVPLPMAIDNSPFGRISTALKTKAATEQVRLALGYTVADDAAKAEAFKYISSVLMEIQKSMGTKKDLTGCSPDSIVQSMIDAASYRLPIDGRGLAFLVKYDNRASFQPGYKGMLFKISEQYKDVDFTAEPVFEGDTLELSDDGGYQTYKHTRTNPFQSDLTKMSGMIACLVYSTDSGRHSKVVAIPKSEIDLIRSKAKQDFIWKEWPLEKAKAAALKRLCKINFTTALGIQSLAQFDNDEHFEIAPAANDITPAKPTEKLKAILAGASV